MHSSVKLIAKYLNDYLDPIVSNYNYVQIALTSSILFCAIKFGIGKPRNVDVHGFVHAILTGPPAALCVLLNFYAVQLSGEPEPLRSIKCQGALTPLHTILPMISLGYAVVDFIDGILSWNREYILHGVCMFLSFGSICHIGTGHLVTPLLIMELSCIFLNLLYAEVSEFIKITIQFCFVLLFFLTRIVVAPFLWLQWLHVYYLHIFSRREATCHPWWLIYVVWIFGIVFHGLNVLWMWKISKKLFKVLSKKKKN